MMRIRILLLLVLITGFIKTGIAQPKVGEKATDISLPGLSGSPLSLSSLKGKVVLIDFWASWCKPCRKSFPELKATYTTYKNKGFEVFGISVDSDPEDWKKAVNADKLQWIVVNDASGDIAVKWDVNYIPNSFLLDRQGKIVAINPSHSELVAHLKKLL